MFSTVKSERSEFLFVCLMCKFEIMLKDKDKSIFFYIRWVILDIMTSQTIYNYVV